jgi:hypothetical protein
MLCCCSSNRKKGSKKPGFEDNNIQNMGDKVYLIQIIYMSLRLIH